MASGASVPPQKEYTIGGVKVLFPVKPYPSQMAMMAQIIKGLQRRQNCLLESPTGSGKSLALLCSTLAWHQAEKAKAQKYNDLIAQGITDPDILARAAGLTNLPSNIPATQDSQVVAPSSPVLSRPRHDLVNSTTPTQQAAAAANAAATGGGFIPDDEFDPDFRSQAINFRNPIPMDVSMDDSMAVPDPHFMIANGPEQPRPPMMKVPKIYFGTRTHKQIYQIVKELRRTPYKNVRTTILSSREHTCIHPVVGKMKNKNEGCQQLCDPREGSGCRFNNGVPRIKTHDRLKSHPIQDAWDIEDLVVLGKKIGACPYFAARSLKETAEIVFCPYNYLVDPLIRDTMSIELKDQIVVLDEAHNIEDSARDSVSCTMKEDEFHDAIKDLNRLVELKFCEEECRTLSQILSSLNGWIDLNKEELNDYKEFDRSGRILSGTDMVANLKNLQVGPERYEELMHCFTTVTAEQDPEELAPRLKTPTSMFLRALFLMLRFLYMDDMKYRDDYRVAIVRTQVRAFGNRDKGGFFKKKGSVGWEYSLNFWCLNPGVSFFSVGDKARSVILTSGTLSPMSSFQSELSVPFQIQLEANHVIDKNQVWVGTVGRGPTDQMLQATYKHTETWQFQDEIGRLALSVCETIPHGVLCFLPSYSMLNKLYERWQCTGLWDEISNIKLPVTEPRKSSEFEPTLQLFYDTIEDTRHVEKGSGINGAFLMAVCRGKVSEGLDFTDDNARAVISVGIPFPNVKDIQVDLKRQYNNQHTKARGLLPGADWYEIQAYRALNQALGRCIRHRYDWGALILVDERFQRGHLSSGTQPTKYTRGLSKWVRNKVVHHHSFGSALTSLRQFSQNMITNPPVKPESLEQTLNDSTSDIEKLPANVTSCCLNNPKTDSSSNMQSNMICHAEISEPRNVSNHKSSDLTENALKEVIEIDASTNDDKIQSSTIEDPDFLLSEDNFFIPAGRVPYTSTQVSGLKDISLLALSPISQVKGDVTEVKGNADSPVKSPSPRQVSKIESEPSFQTPNISSTPKLLSSWFVKATDLMTPTSLSKSGSPTRKRKSFSLTLEDEVEQNKTAVNESQQNIFKNEENLMLKNMETVHEDDENQEIKYCKEETEVDKGNHTFEKYNSDDDLFGENSPLKPSRKLKEGILSPISNTLSMNNIPDEDKNFIAEDNLPTKHDVSESSGCSSSIGKEKLGFATENKRIKKSPNTQKTQMKLTQWLEKDNSTLNDTDKEDFCLDKSYSTPKFKKRRK